MPFITEEIWQRVAPRAGVAGKSIMRQAFPAVPADAADPSIESEMRWVMDFVLGVRRIRGELDIAPSVPLAPRLQGASAVKLSAEQIEAVLRSIRCPTLLLMAAASAPDNDTLALARRCIAGLELDTVPGGHHFHLEGQAELAARHMARFIGTPLAGAGG